MKDKELSVASNQWSVIKTQHSVSGK